MSGRGRASALLLALALGQAGGGEAAEPPAAALTIVEPAAGRYVSGRARLAARLEPEGLEVVRVTFAVDGHAVCAREGPPFECEWDAGPGVDTHHVRAVAVLRDGSRLVDTVRTEAAGFAPGVDVNVVQVAATVTDRKGRFVKGLGLEAFRIFEDDRRQEVTHFIGEDAPRELVVAVDMSASMSPAMAACRRAVTSFLDSLRPTDHVTLLAFNDTVFTVARREADAAARRRAIGRLRSWGSTALFDAVLTGLDLVDRERGRRALVLFTDGEDQISHASVEEVERRTEVTDAPVYVVAQGKGVREPDLRRVLDRLAGVSGGRAFYTDRIEELEGVFAVIREDLASQYLLGYDPSNAERDGTWRAIRVEVPGTTHAVRARQGYRAAEGVR